MVLQVARRLRRSSIGCFDVAATRPAMFARNSVGSFARDRGCSLDAMEGKWWHCAKHEDLDRDDAVAEREMWAESVRRGSVRCGRRPHGGEREMWAVRARRGSMRCGRR
jgi:hypothetical protein